MNKEERIEYLEEERKKILEKIITLEEQLSKKTSDYENEAKLSSEKSAEFKNLSEEAKNTIVRNLEDAISKLAAIKIAYDSFEKLNIEIQEYSKNSKENSGGIKTIYDSIEKKSAAIQAKIAEIEKIFDSKPILDEKLVKLEGVFTKGDDYDSKLASLHKQITDRKKEIDTLYYEIIGYTEKNEEGVEVKVAGLKDELQNSYAQIKVKYEEIDKELAALKISTKTDYDKFIEDKGRIFSDSAKVWEDKYSKIEKTIVELLPNALTAGLSYAYSEKKLSEEKESVRISKTFYIAIGGLIIVSLIPFALSLKAVFDGTSLEEVILRIPRVVFAILPLYVPLLWVAYSANRKMNLSKRLTEEYSHKEVLSKTFEGLSKQINSIDDKDISSDLRVKLLYNILEVNSENPGKLISDYNKSDHPLMDALDKSIKLTNAVTKLSKIPGFSKLASSLEKKAQEILKEEAKKADAGIESLSTESPDKKSI